MSVLNILRSFGITAEDILVKGHRTDGLVRKKVQVRTKRGIYTAYRWIKPDEVSKEDLSKRVLYKKDNSSGYSDAEWLENGGGWGQFR